MKHIVNLVVSQPDHEFVSMRARRQDKTIIQEANSPEEAINRATRRVRSLGLMVHSATIVEQKAPVAPKQNLTEGFMGSVYSKAYHAIKPVIGPEYHETAKNALRAMEQGADEADTFADVHLGSGHEAARKILGKYGINTHGAPIAQHAVQTAKENAQSSKPASALEIYLQNKASMMPEHVEQLEEKLTAADPASKWIHDFVHSDDPKFAGKSKKERMQQALGAYYAAKREVKEEAEQIEESDDMKALKKQYKEHGITTGKHGGDDDYSHAIFVNGSPAITGLHKRQVPSYMQQILKRVQEKKAKQANTLKEGDVIQFRGNKLTPAKKAEYIKHHDKMSDLHFEDMEQHDDHMMDADTPEDKEMYEEGKELHQDAYDKHLAALKAHQANQPNAVQLSEIAFRASKKANDYTANLGDKWGGDITISQDLDEEVEQLEEGYDEDHEGMAKYLVKNFGPGITADLDHHINHLDSIRDSHRPLSPEDREKIKYHVFKTLNDDQNLVSLNDPTRIDPRKRLGRRRFSQVTLPEGYYKRQATDKEEDESEKADKDYDGDGEVESAKDEVWGSRAKAAAEAGKPFKKVDEARSSGFQLKKPTPVDKARELYRNPNTKAVPLMRAIEAAKAHNFKIGKGYTFDPHGEDEGVNLSSPRDHVADEQSKAHKIALDRKYNVLISDPQKKAILHNAIPRDPEETDGDYKRKVLQHPDFRNLKWGDLAEGAEQSNSSHHDHMMEVHFGGIDDHDTKSNDAYNNGNEEEGRYNEEAAKLHQLAFNAHEDASEANKVNSPDKQDLTNYADVLSMLADQFSKFPVNGPVQGLQREEVEQLDEFIGPLLGALARATPAVMAAARTYGPRVLPFLKSAGKQTVKWGPWALAAKQALSPAEKQAQTVPSTDSYGYGSDSSTSAPTINSYGYGNNDENDNPVKVYGYKESTLHDQSNVIAENSKKAKIAKVLKKITKNTKTVIGGDTVHEVKEPTPLDPHKQITGK